MHALRSVRIFLAVIMAAFYNDQYLGKHKSYIPDLALSAHGDGIKRARPAGRLGGAGLELAAFRPRLRALRGRLEQPTCTG